MEGTIEVDLETADVKAMDPNGGPTIAGTYRVSMRLGSGGMGDVHQAEHLRLGTLVAIKFLRASALGDPRSRDRFRREARRAAAILSEHVVRVFDYGHLDDGTPYLVMERLFGEDLRVLLAREGALPIRRAVNIVLDACRGAGAAHCAGLVHRDLKPANLFVERNREGKEKTKVLDFGVAKALESDATRPGALVGTLRYMAPEQLENAAAATPASDVYALGAILYECLTGVPARSGESLEQMVFDIMQRAVARPSVHRDLPPALESAVLRALARDPNKRFASTEDFMCALAPFGSLKTPRAMASTEDTIARDESGDFRPRLRSSVALRWGATVGACLTASGVGWLAHSWYDRPEPSLQGAVHSTRSRPVPMPTIEHTIVALAEAPKSSELTQTFGPVDAATVQATCPTEPGGPRKRSSIFPKVEKISTGPAKTPPATPFRAHASAWRHFDLTDPYE